MPKTAVALNHKTDKYNGKTYNSFTGSVEIGGRHFLLSINANGSAVKLSHGEYKGKKTSSVWVNIVEFDPNNTKSNKTGVIH